MNACENKISRAFLVLKENIVQHKLIRGTFLLVLSGITVKIIGGLNWIFLSRIIGGEGMGLYQMAYPFYLFALTLSCSGIPTAVALITSEYLAQKDYGNLEQTFKVILAFSLLISVTFFFGLLCLAELLTKYELLRDTRAYFSIIALAPAVFFVTILACFRGYFQGYRIMLPIALTEITEQVVRVFAMLLLAFAFLKKGIAYAAGGASLGAALGAIAGLVVMLYYFKKQKKVEAVPVMGKLSLIQTINIIKQFGRVLGPVIAVNLFNPLVGILESLIVVNRLAVAGYTVQDGTMFYGYYTGVALPLVFACTIFSSALAINIMPIIAGDRMANNFRKVRAKTQCSCIFAFALSLPLCMILYWWGESIAHTIYNARAAGGIIKIMSLSVIGLSLQQISSGILQGMRQIPILSRNIVVAACIKIGICYICVGNPNIGIEGAAWATNADYSIGAILNIYYIWVLTKMG
ncbi:MAG: polysaccharide biosynthesis protein [Acidaminococcaceae bacterium]|jgi:stage V sporulation protein B|nr:polysaccharide biosynthesis protein [Acidaminococcaceae bacterium]